ncbi:MAG: dihydropteroate synthase, partial [Syntrophobacterales bacterium]
MTRRLGLFAAYEVMIRLFAVIKGGKSMLVVGERINSSRKGIELALRKRDAELIAKEARDQVNAGAHVIDVNTATLMEEEIESLKWAVQLIGDSVDIPICIDSPDPVAVADVLPTCKGKAM